MPGQVIGVVGRSGSGKTTLTRLIQGIELPQGGGLQLDGVDIRQIDLAHLRRGIGVVLQENLLFRGTIRENIAAARPEASCDEVVAAARLAGADEFIRAPARCPTTRWSRRAAPTSRAASASASPSRAPC